MTRMDALCAYAYNGTWSISKEGELGTLEPGKLADIVVFDHDIMTKPAAGILKTHVAYTILGGNILYRGQEFSSVLQP